MRGIPESTPEDWLDIRRRLREARISPDMVDVVILSVGIDRDTAVATLRDLLSEDRDAIDTTTVEDKTRLAALARIMAGKLVSLYHETAARSRSGAGRVSLLLWGVKLLGWSAELSGLSPLEDFKESESAPVKGVRIGPKPKRKPGRPKGSKTMTEQASADS